MREWEEKLGGGVKQRVSLSVRWLGNQVENKYNIDGNLVSDVGCGCGLRGNCLLDIMNIL